jgi:alginate O-acetyltransferase complex protein AlgI
MFPQLIAGPIVCYEDIQEQLTNRLVDEEKIVHGIFRFVIGLSKKVILANQAGKMWEMLGTDSIVLSWMGALFYAFQIYFDFSGYSDMAIGLGEIFGFTFPENFNYPYISRSITQFWRRWHMTLSGWFLNYLYIPLGGSRQGKLKMLRNLLIVWFLTGLWHGAGWNFILWGLYFFVLLSVEKLFLLPILEKVPRIFSHLYTIFFLLVGWMIFAADGAHLKSMFIGNLMSVSTLYELKNNGIFLVILIICSLPIGQLQVIRKCSERMRFFVKAVVSFVLLFTCIAFLVGDAYNPFLYFRF